MTCGNRTPKRIIRGNKTDDISINIGILSWEMSGQRRSSVDAQFTQQNIGKFVNINKGNKDKGVDKGETKTGTDPTDHIKTSATKQLGHSSTIAPKKCLGPASKSPEEVRQPPSK